MSHVVHNVRTPSLTQRVIIVAVCCYSFLGLAVVQAVTLQSSYVTASAQSSAQKVPSVKKKAQLKKKVPLQVVQKREPHIAVTAPHVNGTVPPTALRVPLVTYAITAGDDPIEIRSVLAEQRGMAQIGIFDAILLLDGDGEGAILGDAPIRANARAYIQIEPIIIPARETHSFTLAGDAGHDLSAYDGQMPAVVIAGVESSISLMFPATQVPIRVVSSATIGDVHATRGGDDPHGQRTVYIQETGIRFGALRLEVSSVEDVAVRSITWRQVGTADGLDIHNIRARVQGVWCAATREGREYTAVCPVPVVVPRGTSSDIVLEGDIGSTGANRTIRFDIGNSYDIVTFGRKSRHYVPVFVGGSTSESDESTFNTSDGTTDGDSIVPFFYRGSTFSIISATMSVGK